jgi:hypothetical protein
VIAWANGTPKKPTLRLRSRPQGPPGAPAPAQEQAEQDDEVFGGGALEVVEGEEVEDGYVFNPADFPMLDGEDFEEFEGDEDDFFGEEELEEGEQGARGEEGDEAKAPPAAPMKKRRQRLPVVAVIGRPNVGKSTVVNRICKTMSMEPGAIVYDYEGVTRDRIYRRCVHTHTHTRR